MTPNEKANGVNGLEQCKHRMDLIEIKLAVENALPAEFKFYKFQVVKKGLELTGECAPLLANGDVAWKYGDKATRRKFVVTKMQEDVWVDEYQKKTGNCTNCFGRGETLASIGKDGSTYRPCTKCNSTGKLTLNPATGEEGESCAGVCEE